MAIAFLDLTILLRAIHQELKGERKEAAFLQNELGSKEGFSWSRVMKQYRFFHARARQRKQLYSLSDRQLKDMGISRADALREANKPFWES